MMSLSKNVERLALLANPCFDGFEGEEDVIESAMRIRAVELRLLKLFSEGRVNGTVHTCVGQEFIGPVIAKFLRETDWVTSNHRCHGHFIAKTGLWRELIYEVMGDSRGVCSGNGGSQHLYSRGFLSNGIQGSLLPVATGIAYSLSQEGTGDIAVSFIGEGTLGEGIVYETLNVAALKKCPHLIVCERNAYQQSSLEIDSLVGSIRARAEAFDIKVFEADTWGLSNFQSTAYQAVGYVRHNVRPALFIIDTYRLMPHSKGDDTRQSQELDFFRSRDPIESLLNDKSDAWRGLFQNITDEVENFVSSVTVQHSDPKAYVKRASISFDCAEPDVEPDLSPERGRLNVEIGRGLSVSLSQGAMLIGEDIQDPYGGAFKVSKGLTIQHGSEKVQNFPISEAALIGFSTGVALMGREVYAEIMFGDFITLAFDQIVNNISKFRAMYDLSTDIPIRIRAPMGGGRAYGPTHSQALERHFLGLPNIVILYTSSLGRPKYIYDSLRNYKSPVIIFENKVDYQNYIVESNEYYSVSYTNDLFPDLVVSPKRGSATITVVTYGGICREILDKYVEFYEEADEILEIICLQKLFPLNLESVKTSITETNRLLTVDEGTVYHGIGSEVVTRLLESGCNFQLVGRIGAMLAPIPASAEAEEYVLPSARNIINILRQNDIR